MMDRSGIPTQVEMTKVLALALLGISLFAVLFGLSWLYADDPSHILF